MFDVSKPGKYVSQLIMGYFFENSSWAVETSCVFFIK